MRSQMYIPEWEIENAIVWNPALVEISGSLEKLSFIENQRYLKNTGRYIDILFQSNEKLVIVEVNYRRLKAGGIPLHRIPIEKM